MALPVVALATETIELGGQSFSVRELSRGEAMQMAEAAAAKNGSEADAAQMEIVLLSHGLDTTLDEVRDWYAHAPSHVVQALVAKIMSLSGMDDLPNAPSAG
jgi:hypothetical protein